jgi:hypothetical protein
MGLEMTRQAEDTRTADIFDMTGARMSDESKEPEEEEDLHLAAHHHLVKVQAYIRDEKKAEKKSAIAERVAKHREKKKSSGLVALTVPVEIAQAIKSTVGGFDAWFTAQKAAPVVVEVPGPERVVEVVKEVPAVLTPDQERLIGLGRSIDSLTGWRRWLVNFGLSR